MPEPASPAPTAPPADVYDAGYYAHGCGRPYQRDAVWLGFFGGVADRIVEGIRPGSVMDAGCALGFLVETLRDRGVDAWGVDISAYAIDAAFEAIRPYVRVASVTVPFGRRFDLVTCIEVVEHMPPAEAAAAIANLCAHADDVLFSSSPYDHRELTHHNVQPPAYWAELFARHGFYRDVDFDASFLTPWAVRYRKSQPVAADPVFGRVVAGYERALWRLDQAADGRRQVAIEQRGELMAKDRELEDLRGRLERLDADRLAQDVRVNQLTRERDNLVDQVNALHGRWHALETSPSWSVVQRLQHLRARLMPPGGPAEAAFIAAIGWKHLAQQRGLRFLAGHMVREGRAQGAYRLRAWRRRRHPEHVDWLAVPSAPPVPPVEPRDLAVDIVVCVHDALDDVQRCLAAVRRHTAPPYRLVVVDDGSAAPTADWLRADAAAHPGTVLLRADAAGGYTRAANRGLRHALAHPWAAGRDARRADGAPDARGDDPRADEPSAAAGAADAVVFLNSDTVVTPGWLDRLAACAASDPAIGLVGPLSNAATYQSVPEVKAGEDWAANPLPDGIDADRLAELIAADSARLYPRVPFLNGFCLFVKRAVVDAIGAFDEDAFGAGYGEENDYALRARAAGWQLAVADDAFVYHAASRSYSHERRRPLVERAGRALVEKHGESAVAAGVAALEDHRVLAGIGARVAYLPDRWRITRGGRDRFSGKRVLFVLPVAAAGGGASIAMFEMRAMRAMGVDAALFNLTEHRAPFEAAYPDLDLPVVYGQPEDLMALAPGWDALVATMYTTVDWLATASRGARGAGTVYGYFIQDLEAYFYPPGSPRFHAALQSYATLPGLRMFAMTPWNAAELGKLFGIDCPAVMPGYDAALFRPRPRPGPEWPARPLRIAGMVRPATPFRQPRLTMEVFEAIARAHGPAVEMVVFGVRPEHAGWDDLPRGFPFKLAGTLGPRQMPMLLNEVDVFVDFSTWQGMGMTAMEAMACGAAVVVTREGGPEVFARHGENCLLVDPHDRGACVAALDLLVRDGELRRRLQAQGRRDIPRWYPERAAFNMLEALFGPELDAADRARAAAAAEAAGEVEVDPPLVVADGSTTRVGRRGS